MIGRLSMICACAVGALLACGGQASQNGASAGSGSDSNAAAGTGVVSGGVGGASVAGGGNDSRAGAGGSATVGLAGSGALAGSDGIPDMSDPGSGTCTAFTPCGGPLAGTWRLDSACLSPPVLAPVAACATAHEELSVAGSLSFATDGTVDVSQVQLTANIVLPPSCISDAAACTALSSTLGTCTPTPDGGCQCVPDRPTTKPPTPMETYVVSGNSVAISVTNEAPTTAYYCITGERLLLRGRATNSNTASPTLTYVYSMTRQ
jgi:hypothetical protein